MPRNERITWLMSLSASWSRMNRLGLDNKKWSSLTTKIGHLCLHLYRSTNGRRKNAIYSIFGTNIVGGEILQKEMRYNKIQMIDNLKGYFHRQAPSINLYPNHVILDGIYSAAHKKQDSTSSYISRLKIIESYLYQ